MVDQRDAQLGEVFARDLREVLGCLAEIRNVFFESLGPGARLDDDIVLVTTHDKVMEVQNHVKEARRIMVAQRTIRESEAYRIFTIPPGTKVLVVNNLPETTLEMVALLQQLEVNHLQFIPFEPGMDCGDIRIAITPGERGLVPAGIETVIDIGHRSIDISTYIEILNRLKNTDREIDHRLLRYAKGNVNLDIGINHQYMELFKRNTELDAVINHAHEGILLLNTQGRITLFNKALAEMLGLKEDSIGAGIEVLPPEVQDLLGQPQSHEWLVETRGRSIVVNRQDIQYFGEPGGSYFNFREVTYIRQLEQNLSRKLRERGLTTRYSFRDVLTHSPSMRHCLELARRIAGTDFTVLIMGESGTGKELLAQSIQNESSRSKLPFVAVNCAAVPEQLLESELFGYAGGSFTGALREGKEGLFEQANNGTVFLDEIGDMPMMLQAKLLRVLQERQIMRVGSNRLTQVNIRVIAATNRNLDERIRAGLFRDDLYYRLNALSLLVPPLRERQEDILPLLGHFLEQHNRGRLTFSAGARELLLTYPWPGNIRELGNVANHITLMADREVTVDTLPAYLVGKLPDQSFAVESGLLAARCGLERARALLTVLAQFAGRDLKAGRRSLCTALLAQGQSVTEAEVRGILQVLTEGGLAHSSLGRRGTELSSRGLQFIRWLNNGSVVTLI
jgi:transcriptional regulator with PAS, ATPase and Fis domain